MKNSESPAIRNLIHDHIQVFKAYRILCNHSKRRVVQECLLGVEKSCTSCCLLGVEKSLQIWQRVFCQVVYKKLILTIQNQDKKNLKRVAWGLDVGHEDRTRIKSLFASFLRFIPSIFLLLQVFILNANHLCF